MNFERSWKVNSFWKERMGRFLIMDFSFGYLFFILWVRNYCKVSFFVVFFVRFVFLGLVDSFFRCEEIVWIRRFLCGCRENWGRGVGRYVEERDKKYKVRLVWKIVFCGRFVVVRVMIRFVWGFILKFFLLVF